MKSFPFRVTLLNSAAAEKISNAAPVKGIEILRPSPISNAIWLRVTAKTELGVFRKAGEFLKEYGKSVQVLMLAKREDSV